MRERSSPLALVSSFLAVVAIAACTGGGGGGSGDDDDDDDDDAASPITVTGVIQDNAGNPLEAEDVLVAGTLLTTNSAGQFTLANVIPPYDIVHYYAPGDYVSVYPGATRTDPTISIFSGSPDSIATVSGTISPTIGAGTLTVQGLYPPIYSQSGGSFSMNSYTNRQFRWFQTASLNTTFHYIRYETDANGVVNNLIDYKAQAVTLDDGSTPTINVTMDAAVEGALTGNVTLPAGYSIDQVSADVLVDGDSILRLGDTTAGTFSYITLSGAGLTASVEARGIQTGLDTDSAYGIASFTGAPTSSTTLAIPEGGVFTSPAANATLSPGTAVTWTNTLTGSQGHILFVSPDDFTGTTMRFFAGGATSLTVPDLTLLGVALGTEAYTVRATSFAPGVTTDDFLTGSGFFLPAPSGLSYSSSTDYLPVMGP